MRFLIPIVVALFAFHPRVVVAQDSPEPRSAEEDKGTAHQQMLELSERGFAAFSEGRFAEAAQTFARAYALEPDTLLLKNEAIAWYEAGEHEPAVDAASRFLIQEDNDPSDVIEVRRVWSNAKLGLVAAAMDNGTLDLAEELLGELDASEPDTVVAERIRITRIELAKRQQAQRIAREEAEKAERDRIAEAESKRVREEELRLQREIETQRTAAAQARAAMASGAVEELRQLRQAKTAGYIAIGTGAAILIGTTVYHVAALGWERQFYTLAEDGGSEERFERLRDRLTVARAALPIFYVLGAATGASGAWVVIRTNRKQNAIERPELSVVVGGRWDF